MAAREWRERPVMVDRGAKLNVSKSPSKLPLSLAYFIVNDVAFRNIRGSLLVVSFNKKKIGVRGEEEVKEEEEEERGGGGGGEGREERRRGGGGGGGGKGGGGRIKRKGRRGFEGRKEEREEDKRREGRERGRGGGIGGGRGEGGGGGGGE
ncbi:hypothetical protein HZH68_013801 [Vespula germanica]|uniref:Uncharacterized protein n=1 Tax=Vespula germanica TaxID=30212 RepID=A0A834JBC1_VESGE|nr:hypothetical protein HZH68_013801 [Vespula germanica]